MSKLKRWAGNSSMILGGLVVGTLMLEIGLRIAGISYPNFYMADKYRGLAPRPGAEGWYRQEGEAYIRINSAGFRDREHAKPKPANTLRIAVLGDSYVEAIQIPMEKTFWAAMEHELGRCAALGERSVEVINFGVGGYGTAQELITLRHGVWDYSPDIVVLAFVTGNDISDNSHVLKQSDYEPYFIYRSNELVLDDSFLESRGYRLRQSWLPQLIERSRVLQVFNEVRRHIRTQLRRLKAMRQLSITSNNVNTQELGLNDRIYFEPSDPVWAEAWRVTEGSIVLMRDEVTEQGADFLVVSLSNPIQVHPDSSVREEFMKSLGIDDLFYPDLRIKALGERERFSVLNLAQPFQAYAEERQVFLHGFKNTAMGKGHWNAEGHRLAGQMIVQKICEQFLN